MSVTKPSTVPRWADTGISGRNVEPSEPKKTAGWLPGEKPPAQILNWWMALVYSWVLWLQDITNQAFTWAAIQTFTSGVNVSGHGAQTSNIRAIASGTGIHGVLAEGSDGGGSGVTAQGGADGGDGIVATSSGDGGVGVRGVGLGADYAGSFLNDDTGIALFATRTSAPSSIAHTCRFVGYSGGIVATGAALAVTQAYTHGSGWTKRAPAIVVEEGSMIFPGTQPTAAQDVGFNNLLCGANILKASAAVFTNTIGTMAVQGGFGVASCTVNAGDHTQADVVFTRAMADANYSITFGASSAAGAARNAQLVHASRTLNGFSWVLFDSAGSAIDLNANTNIVMFHVHGKQS